ncbi:hypothetical protein GCM10020216_090890 [Nonomuraea helvata]
MKVTAPTVFTQAEPESARSQADERAKSHTGPSPLPLKAAAYQAEQAFVRAERDDGDPIMMDIGDYAQESGRYKNETRRQSDTFEYGAQAARIARTVVVGRHAPHLCRVRSGPTFARDAATAAYYERLA